MNKTELIKKVASTTGLTDKDTERTIDATLDVIRDTIKADEEVMLTGFGVFSSKTRHARTGVNPQNPSQKIQIPEVRVPKFKAGKALKDALKGKTDGTSLEASRREAKGEAPKEEPKPEAELKEPEPDDTSPEASAKGEESKESTSESEAPTETEELSEE